MDALDKFILEAELIHGWRATAVHEVQRDQPNRCRTYLEEFNSEREIVELCGQRNMRRIVRAIAFSKLEIPGIVPITPDGWADSLSR
jgi:hypothetical protein